VSEDQGKKGVIIFFSRKGKGLGKKREKEEVKAERGANIPPQSTGPTYSAERRNRKQSQTRRSRKGLF